MDWKLWTVKRDSCKYQPVNAYKLLSFSEQLLGCAPAAHPSPMTASLAEHVTMKVCIHRSVLVFETDAMLQLLHRKDSLQSRKARQGPDRILPQDILRDTQRGVSISKQKVQKTLC